MKRILFIFLGFLALAIGAVGIVVPVLPTTPLVLLASACFAYADPRLYRWLSNTKYFGEFIANYKNKTGIPKDVKIKALIFLYVTLGISFVIFGLWYVRLILVLVAVGVSIHILRMETKTEEPAENPQTKTQKSPEE